MAKSNGHTASMNRSFISSWIKTALPTISTYSMTSFASGKTTTITIDRTEPSMGRPHTSGSWQKLLPVCHLCLETLQRESGAGSRNRTHDQRFTKPLLYQLSYAGPARDGASVLRGPLQKLFYNLKVLGPAARLVLRRRGAGRGRF